jgi:hypothetical protein
MLLLNLDVTESEYRADCGSAGSWPAADGGDKFVSCSTNDPNFWSFI